MHSIFTGMLLVVQTLYTAQPGQACTAAQILCEWKPCEGQIGLACTEKLSCLAYSISASFAEHGSTIGARHECLNIRFLPKH